MDLMETPEDFFSSHLYPTMETKGAAAGSFAFAMAERYLSAAASSSFCCRETSPT